MIPRLSPSGPSILLLEAPGEIAQLSGAAVTIDWTKGSVQEVTLNHATPVIDLTSTLPAGKSATVWLRVNQDATGNRIPTLPQTYTPGGSGLTFSTGAGAFDIVQGIWNGSILAVNFLGKNFQ